MNCLVSHSLAHLRRSTTRSFCSPLASANACAIRTLSTTGTPSPPAETPSTDLNKRVLADNVRATFGLPAGVSVKIVSSILDNIVESVSSGKTVKLSGFGTFDSYESKAKVGKNPKTQESVSIPSRRRIRFKAYKGFKEIVDPSLKKSET